MPWHHLHHALQMRLYAWDHLQFPSHIFFRAQKIVFTAPILLEGTGFKPQTAVIHGYECLFVFSSLFPPSFSFIFGILNVTYTATVGESYTLLIGERCPKGCVSSFKAHSSLCLWMQVLQECLPSHSVPLDLIEWPLVGAVGLLCLIICPKVHRWRFLLLHLLATVLLGEPGHLLSVVVSRLQIST